MGTGALVGAGACCIVVLLLTVCGCWGVEVGCNTAEEPAAPVGAKKGRSVGVIEGVGVIVVLSFLSS